MQIDHGAPEPLYQQLAALIRDQIASGELAPRTMVPSITTLAADHNLSVVTVRKAMGLLIKEGLVQTVPGRGTFVVG
ncbi:MAG: winged helix-turn-helix domain-containing protein [Actinomycetota bacterium]